MLTMKGIGEEIGEGFRGFQGRESGGSMWGYLGRGRLWGNGAGALPPSPCENRASGIGWNSLVQHTHCVQISTDH